MTTYSMGAPEGSFEDDRGAHTSRNDFLELTESAGKPDLPSGHRAGLKPGWVKSENCWKNRRGFSGLRGVLGLRFRLRTPDPVLF